jgi:hypothetical protein
MSVSKQWVNNPINVTATLHLYRSLKNEMTMEKIAVALETTLHNISHVLRANMSKAELATIKAVKYSASKTGNKNPMKDKFREQHHNWQGECSDCKGYLTILFNGKRVFVHQAVMMEHLGILQLPENMAVHHIDNNPLNNALDNLALTTGIGHRTLHYLQAQDSLVLKSRKSTIAEALQYMT